MFRAEKTSKIALEKNKMDLRGSSIISLGETYRLKPKKRRKKEKKRKKERKKDRQTDRQKDRQTDRQTERKKERKSKKILSRSIKKTH